MSKYDKQHSNRLTKVESNTVSNAVRGALLNDAEKQGGAAAIVVRHTSKGVTKDKVKAQAALSDEQALGKVLAAKIIEHLDGGERGIYGEMMRLDKATLDAKKSALGEVIATQSDRVRDVEIEFCGDEMESFRVKKINSIRASFSRIVTVIKAMTSTRDTYNFTLCENFSEMVAIARENSKGKGKNTKTLTGSGFKTWSEKVDRIVDLKNYDPKGDASIAQVARLEKFLVLTVGTYCKVADKVTGLRFDPKVLQSAIGIKVAPKVRHLKAA